MPTRCVPSPSPPFTPFCNRIFYFRVSFFFLQLVVRITRNMDFPRAMVLVFEHQFGVDKRPRVRTRVVLLHAFSFLFCRHLPHPLPHALRLSQMTMQTALEGAVYSALSAARTKGDTDQVAALENVRDWLDYDSTNATLTEMTAKADFLRNNLGVAVNTE